MSQIAYKIGAITKVVDLKFLMIMVQICLETYANLSQMIEVSRTSVSIVTEY